VVFCCLIEYQEREFCHPGSDIPGMPFSDLPVFLLSPHGEHRFEVHATPLSDLHHLQGICRYISRYQGRASCGQKH
jgi:hypothetical protein